MSYGLIVFIIVILLILFILFFTDIEETNYFECDRYRSKRDELQLDLPEFNPHEYGIYGMKHEMEYINKHVIIPLRADKELMKKLNKKNTNKGILLYGRPGNGKTYIAMGIARYLTRNVKLHKGSSILNKYVGESEKNISKIFNEAYKNPDKYFVHIIDECETIFPNRGGIDVSKERVSILNEFLSHTGNDNCPSNLFFIMLTNHKQNIDPAVIRDGRVGIHLEISEPDYETRKEIFKYEIEKIDSELRGDIDFDSLAYVSEGCTSSRISSIVDKMKNSYMIDFMESKEYVKIDTEKIMNMI